MLYFLCPNTLNCLAYEIEKLNVHEDTFIKKV